MPSTNYARPMSDTPIVVGILAGFLAVFIVFFTIQLSNKADDKRTELYNCIEEKSQSDGFPGNIREAWNTYYSVCNSN